MRAFYNISAILLFFFLTAFLSKDAPDEIMDCASRAGAGAVYLKDFQVSLPAAKAGEKPPMYRQAVVLRGNTLYRFNVCNKQGEAVIHIYDETRMILTTYDAASKKDNNPIQLLCKKTAPYNIVITYKDGKAGESIAIMSNVRVRESRR